jgi:hypothetical protein
VDQYRRLTTLSSLLGVVVLAAGIWEFAHARWLTGILFVVLGLALGLWTGFLRIGGVPAPLAPKHAGQEQWTPRVLHFYTRRECSLCEEAKVRLEPHLAARHISLVEHDVDRDPVLRERYGTRVPVAVYDGAEVFALQFDEAAVRTLR